MSGVAVEFDDGVALLTLKGDNRLNTFDIEMRDALIEALAAARDDPAVGALVLRAEGENFSAGADLREFGGAADPFEARWIRSRRDPWRILWTLPLPTIAAVKGVTMGSGLEMALLCDLRVCAPSTRFALPEVRLGMLPAACGTQSLPRAIGASRALPLVMTGTEVDAAEAQRLELVHEVDGDPEGVAREWADRLARTAPAGAAALALRAAVDLDLATGLRYEHRLSLYF